MTAAITVRPAATAVKHAQREKEPHHVASLPPIEHLVNRHVDGDDHLA
jgi:hypothetical protein